MRLKQFEKSWNSKNCKVYKIQVRLSEFFKANQLYREKSSNNEEIRKIGRSKNWLQLYIDPYSFTSERLNHHRFYLKRMKLIRRLGYEV